MEFFAPINEFGSANNGITTEKEHYRPEPLIMRWGYGKPPRHAGFKKGQSGTRAGGRLARKTW